MQKTLHILCGFLVLVAIAPSASAQSGPKVLYLTPYANTDSQISEALAGNAKTLQLDKLGTLEWVESFNLAEPDRPVLPVEQSERITGRLATLREQDWVAVEDLAVSNGAPVRILFRDGAAFTARVEQGELVVTQSISEIGLPQDTSRFRDLFGDQSAVGILELPGNFRDEASNTGDIIIVRNLGVEIGPDEPTERRLEVAASPVPVDCGAANGDETTHCALYAARLMSTHRGTICTGTLISDNHLLTAAHCVCDEVANGILSDEITASIGIPGYWAGISLDPEGVHFFNHSGSDICADSGLPLEYRQSNGDLAILTLEDGSLLSAVQRLRDLGVEYETAGRARAALASEETGPSIWQTDAGIAGNVFVTFGFGVGLDGLAGNKRAMKYTFRRLTECLYGSETSDIGCDGLQEGIFHDESLGLCAGDSGSGMFKWADGSRDGFGKWVLMGVVSGSLNPLNCHEVYTDTPLENQYERNIVRVDTDLVLDWIEGIAGPDQIWRTAGLMTPPFSVAGDGN
ncbi:trypsin-like serine protease [Pseudoruegeria sp. HB172150]|uniref:trypsin-like serine protease n=1 Tax=Pseudoruegeria sp. HB172150 TaxID=2721164 RepID=UPI001556D706|nr:trypsin-like serine protease [Pseudoruegeria sp. HB172150]